MIWPARPTGQNPYAYPSPRSFIQTVTFMGKKFPTFAFVVLVLGLLWLAVEMHWITIPIPWLPLIVVVVAAGWIVNHYMHG